MDGSVNLEMIQTKVDEEKYVHDMLCSQLILFLQLQNSSRELFWLVDQAQNCPMPLFWQQMISHRHQDRYYYAHSPPQLLKKLPNQWTFAPDNFYSFISSIIQQSLPKNHNPIEQIFTARPPRRIRDILQFAAYMDLKAHNPRTFWLAMLAMKVQSANIQYIGVRNQTKMHEELFDFHPVDCFLSQFQSIETETCIILPKLTAQEQQLIPKDYILAYDFQKYAAFLVSENQIPSLMLMKFPLTSELQRFFLDKIQFFEEFGFPVTNAAGYAQLPSFISRAVDALYNHLLV